MKQSHQRTKKKMRKRQKRLIVIGALSLISLMSLFLMLIGLNHINQSYEMRLPDYVLVQGKSNQLYLANIKKQQVKPLALTADAFSFNQTFNQLYLFNFQSNQTEISLINKYKDIMTVSEQFEIPVGINQDQELDIQVTDRYITLLNHNEQQLIIIDLKKETQTNNETKVVWPTVTQESLDIEVQQSIISEDSLYFVVADQVIRYDLEKKTMETIVEIAGVKELTIHNNFLTIVSQEEDVFYLTSYDRKDGHQINRMMVESKELLVYPSSSEEPEIYYRAPSLKGNEALLQLNVKNYEITELNLPLSNVKNHLQFFKGDAYYVNQEEQASIYTKKNQTINIKLEEKIQNIYPFY